MRASELWNFSGRTNRISYVLIGVFGFAVKSNIDRIVASYGFHRNWSVFNYWFPFPSNLRPADLRGSELQLSLTLLALSFPFVWLGICQTVRRLRDCGQPLWLSVLFFLPFVNLLFFAILCCLPSRVAAPDPGEIPKIEIPRTGVWTGEGKLEAAIVSVFATSVFGIAIVYFGTMYKADYGWGLFVAAPFSLGLFAVLLYSRTAPRRFENCILVSLLPVLLIGMGLLLLAFEGVICLLMAAPLGLGLSVLGGLVGYWVQESRWRMRGHPAVLGVVLLLAPLWMQFDTVLQGTLAKHFVQTTIEIDAPPEIVWEKVVMFSEIPSEREFLFHTGIAYPIRATIAGRGVGAVRRCEFSTGAFVEPIEVWDEPRLLRFSVAESPAPLEELTPYRHIEPPHLKGYFGSEKGQFELVRLQGNRTRLTGTTWYSDKVWPASYWQLWSDYIVHHIHLRVLNHIRAEAEDGSR